MTTRPSFLTLAIAPLLALALFGSAVSAQGGDRVPDGSQAKGMITNEAQKAIDDALAYLASQQANDGSFGTGQFRGNVAITSLVGLAFLAGGHQPGRGKYGKVVSKTVDYILSQEDRVAMPGFFSSRAGNVHGPMYNHGFATLFIAEVHGMVPGKKSKEEVKGALERAVKLIIASQSPQGGWRYNPQPFDADISVTICQIMALRAARNAGIAVPKATVDKCTKYVRECQDMRTGGFSYQQGGHGPGFARTAAGLVAYYSAGKYEGEDVTKGLEFLKNYTPGKGNRGGDREMHMHYYYGHYYAAQAMWTAGGRYWKEWFPAIRDELLRRAPAGHRQQDHWFDGTFCRHYCTAMALIILQIPNNY